MRKKNVNERRIVALENLKKSEFFPKKIKSGKKMVDRSEEAWNEKKAYNIDILEKRISR